MTVDYFYVFNNDITGTLPTQLGSMTVDELYLHYNRITGTLPSELGNMTADFLFLSHNRINGTLPTEFGNMNVVELRLENNFLSGTVPTEFGEMGQLSSLSLQENNLGGIIPETICNNEVKVTADSFTNPPEIDCSCCVGNFVGGGNDCNNNCTVACTVIELTLTTDEFPHETSFSLTSTETDDATPVWNVMMLQPKSISNYTSNICPTKCYRFLIEDTFGDGICCEYHRGEYSLYYDGELVSLGGDFMYSSVAYVGDGC